MSLITTTTVMAPGLRTEVLQRIRTELCISRIYRVYSVLTAPPGNYIPFPIKQSSALWLWGKTTGYMPAARMILDIFHPTEMENFSSHHLNRCCPKKTILLQISGILSLLDMTFFSARRKKSFSITAILLRFILLQTNGFFSGREIIH